MKPAHFSLLMLAGALAVVFHRLLLGEVFFWGLPSLQFVPWRDTAFDLVRQGQLPLWTPYNGAGAPLFANYQSALLYPPNWLGLVLPLAWSMSVTAVLHLFLAGWGMWRFAGRLGVMPLGQGMSALAFGMTSYLVARLGTFPIIETAAWLPWLLWAAHGVMSGDRRRDGAWLALFTGLMLLAGHAQTAWYSLLLVGLYAAWRLVSAWSAARARRFVGVALLIVLGAGVASLQLLATAELLSTSPRSDGVDYAFAMNFSYTPLRALNLISPNMFGTPADGSYIEKGFFFEYAVYIGFIPLISAFAAGVGWWRARRDPERPAVYRCVPFWWVVVIGAFVFALGQHTPIFPFLYRNVPTFDLFQAPVRWHLWTVCGLSVLAGIGASAWGRQYKARQWARRALVAALGVTVISLLVPAPVPGAVALLRGMTYAGIMATAACWLTLRQPDATSPRYPGWTRLVLLVVAADLAWAAWGLNPTVPASFYEPLTTLGTPDGTRAYWTPDAEDAIKFDTFFMPDDYRYATDHWLDVRTSELPNLNLLDRRALLNNFDPLLVGNHAAYMALLERAPNREALLDAANASAVYDERGEAVRRNALVARAWLVDSACWHTSEGSLEAALVSETWTPREQVHLLGDAGCPPVVVMADSPGDVLVSDEGSRVEIVARARRDAWLVLADTDFPGWTATVDGDHAAIYRANVAFRAVQVPPGEHVVRFVYEPTWLLPGTVISVGALVLTLLLFRLNDAAKPNEVDYND